MDKLLKIAVVLTAVDKMSDIIERSVNKSQSRLKSFQHGLNSFGNYSLIAGAAGVEFFHKTIEQAEQSEKAANIARRVWKNMGDASGEAFKKAHEFAEQLAPKIGIVHEKIEAAESKLAIFGKVSDDVARKSGIFQDTILAAYNAQAIGLGDAESNIVTFGRALQGTLRSLKTLGKFGIEKDQLKQIEILQKTGQLHKSQLLILSLLKGQLGSVAKSGVTAAERMHVKWHELQVRIGDKLLPVWNKLIDKLSQVVDWVSKFTEEHPTLVKWLAAGAVGLVALGIAAKVLAFVIGGLTTVFRVLNFVMIMSPFIIIAAAIVTAAVLVVKYWKPIKNFFAGIWSGISRGVSKAWDWITGKITGVVNAVMRVWNDITGFFSGLWSGITGIASNVWNSVANAIVAPIKWIKQKWQDLTDWITKAWGKIKGFFSGLWSGIKSVARDIVTAPVRAAESIVSRNSKVAASMEKTAQVIDDYLPHSPAKRGPLKNLHKVKIVETIAAAINAKPLHAAMNRMTGGIASHQMPQAIAARAGGGTVHVNFNPVYHINGSNKEDVMKMIRERDRELLKTIEEAQRKRDRTKF